VLDSAFAPCVRLPWHAHEAATVALVLRGLVEEQAGGRTWECRLGSAIIKPAGEWHANRYGRDGARCLIVQLSGVAQPMEQWTDALRRPMVVRGRRVPRIARRLLQAIGAEGTAVEEIEILLAELLSPRKARDRRSIPAWIPRVREFLHAHAREPVRWSEVAQLAGVAPSELSREFSRHVGMPPTAYQRELRVEWARERLAAGAAPLARVAADAGFADQSHFTRAYRARYGTVPSASERTECDQHSS
jgi:AraC family transcriptional regulator